MPLVRVRSFTRAFVCRGTDRLNFGMEKDLVRDPAFRADGVVFSANPLRGNEGAKLFAGDAIQLVVRANEKLSAGNRYG